jgi:hypothetical protein
MKMLWLLILKRSNEKIHNRSKPRVASSAVDDCTRFKDHEQWMGQAWPTDHDQWLQAPSSKPQDSRIRPQAWAAERQAPSGKPYYKHN